MKTHRPERVSDLIIEELNKLLIQEIETPGALITITEVDVLKNLSRAVVFVSIYPTEKGPEILKVLLKRQNHLQFMLGRKMNIRPMPMIAFKLDLGPEKAAKVEKKLIEEGGN